MLPSKVFQINYQDYSFLVLKDLEKIRLFENENGSFDFILGKIRNGIFCASIIANELQIPMGIFEAPRHIDYLDYRLFLPHEINENKKYKVLVVDSLCGTGETLKNIKKKIEQSYPLLEVVTYCPITDINALTKPDILSLEINEFIQPPWELKSFTPQAHLDRLESYDIKASAEKENCIGFSDLNLQKNIEGFLGYSFFWNLNFEDEYEKINLNGEFFDVDKEINHINSITQIKNHCADLLCFKEQFIKDNGITHFFESNLKQALLLSQMCCVTNILYFEDNICFKIQAFENDIKF